MGRRTEERADRSLLFRVAISLSVDQGGEEE